MEIISINNTSTTISPPETVTSYYCIIPIEQPVTTSKCCYCRKEALCDNEFKNKPGRYYCLSCYDDFIDYYLNIDKMIKECKEIRKVNFNI